MTRMYAVQQGVSMHNRGLALSLAAYLAIKKASVAAAVDAPDTTMVPGTIPNKTPEVMVRGIAGRARISKSVYSPAYAT